MTFHSGKSRQDCIKGLKNICRFVTASDRKLAMATLDVSYVTVSRYLQGNVPNLNFGLDLLELFTQQLKEREKKIKGLSNDIKPLTRRKGKDKGQA